MLQMIKNSKIKSSIGQIASIFKTKRTVKKEEKVLKTHAMRMNFFLLNAAIKHIEKGNLKKPLSLFTTRILTSKSKHFGALIEQMESVCSHQDIELFSYKEFYCRNQLALHRAIEWKFSKYIKSKEDLVTLIHKMKESSPETFKNHLITLLKEESFPSEELDEEINAFNKQWNLYQQNSSTTGISPL